MLAKEIIEDSVLSFLTQEASDLDAADSEIKSEKVRFYATNGILISSVF